MAVIEARGLRKSFGATRALDGIDLRLEKGRILGLIGPNGAGKSTALNAILVGTQAVMLLEAAAVLLARGSSLAALLAQISPLAMWAAMLYHLLLVSAWARRAAFLWASLPVIAILVIERLVFDTSAFARMLLTRLAGGPAAVPFPPAAHMPMQAPTLVNLGAFLASPGLWIGLAACAAFLAGAVWLHRRQGPI